MLSAGIVTEIEQDLVAAADALSVARIENSKTPACVGTPDNAPLEEPNAMPEGSVPDATDHEYGNSPPETATVELYA
jgi:hypothetical protein